MTTPDFVEVVRSNGGKVYLVGGMIRDYVNMMLNGITHIKKGFKDWDLVVAGIPIDTLETLLSPCGTVKSVGKSFGILTLKTPLQPHMEIDIALPRTEVSTGPGYLDFEIASDHSLPIEKDLERRDATINAMAVEMKSIADLQNLNFGHKDLIDPYAGYQDMKRGVWRTVGDPHKRFVEDPNRITRCLRQSTQLNFVIHEETLAAIRKYKNLLKVVKDQSPVRLTEELVKGLKADSTKMTGLLYNLELFKFFGLRYHGVSVSRNYISALIGLIDTDPDEWVKEWELSAAPSFPKQMVKVVVNGVKNMETATKVESLTDMRKLVSSMEHKVGNQATLYLLEAIPGGNKMCSMYFEIQPAVLGTEDLDITGFDIMEKTGAKGKQIGDFKQKLFDKVIDGLPNKKTDLIDQLVLLYESS